MRKPAEPAALFGVSLLVLVLPACECGASVDRSGGDIPELEAVRVAPDEVALDGRLREAAWQRTGSTGPFVGPGSGQAQPSSPVQGRAHVAWDARFLYVAAVIEDADPSSPFGPDDEDPHIWTRSSGFEVMLQPGDPGSNRHYYEVQVDVAGAVWDTRFDDYNEPITRAADGSKRYGHQRWSSGVRTAIHVDDQEGHYALELALPWESLENPHGPLPPNPGDVWRMNFYSFRDGQRASLAWSPILGEGNFHRAARFGRVRFAAGR